MFSVRYIVDDVDAGQAADGTWPEPGGWNRFQLEVANIDATVTDLRGRGADFRGDIITGRGGRQALLLDPAGNLVELFQPHPG